MARPKKNVTVNEEVKTEALEEKKPAKRGRPRKNPVAAEETKTAVEETVTETPAGNAEEKKAPARRGRKKKTEIIETEKEKIEKKEPAKRGRRKKTEIVETEKKEPAENKNEVELTNILQYKGSEIEQREMVAKVEEAWRAEGNTAAIETIKMYVKPEDGKIYYVVNGLAGSCDLF